MGDPSNYSIEPLGSISHGLIYLIIKLVKELEFFRMDSISLLVSCLLIKNVLRIYIFKISSCFHYTAPWDTNFNSTIMYTLLFPPRIFEIINLNYYTALYVQRPSNVFVFPLSYSGCFIISYQSFSNAFFNYSTETQPTICKRYKYGYSNFLTLLL